jgi:hypothetical protein
VPEPVRPSAVFFLAQGSGKAWFYHIRQRGTTESICGDETRGPDLPLRTWGQYGNKDRYCQDCDKEARSRSLLRWN